MRRVRVYGVRETRCEEIGGMMLKVDGKWNARGWICCAVWHGGNCGVWELDRLKLGWEEELEMDRWGVRNVEGRLKFRR